VIKVQLYTRPDCSECDKIAEHLKQLQSEFPHGLEIIDIGDQPRLEKQIGGMLPVVQVGPYRLIDPITLDQLRITLSAAVDRVRHVEAIDRASFASGTPQKQQITTSDRFSYWFSKHYLAVFNLVTLFYLSLPFLAPILQRAGVEQPTALIYRGYSLMCHQLAFRSVFIFGEQRTYPLESAGIPDQITYEAATGNAPDDLLAAREFVGNEQMGYKIALCQRDIAIYGGILAFGLIFTLTGRKIPPLPWYLWIVIGMFPMALDGGTQLISQLGIPLINEIIPYRESIPLLRYITGFLFGVSTAWFGYPLVESSMRESRQYLDRKFERIRALNDESESRQV
jgi:uncharacterized membrane protein